MLESLEVGRPIAFYPGLARFLGSIEAAIYYQQLFYWWPKGRREDGFIYKTKEEIEEETMLTRRQQDTARKHLESLGWLETKLIKANGVPTLHYLPLISLSLVAQNVHPVSTKTPNPGLGGNVPTHSYENAETLTENTNRRLPETTNSDTPSAITPAEDARSFFQDPDKQKQVVDLFVSKGVDASLAEHEIGKFVRYWTEPNKSGKKQRWELERTFEVRRRIVTWVGNLQKRNGFKGSYAPKALVL